MYVCACMCTFMWSIESIYCIYRCVTNWTISMLNGVHKLTGAIKNSYDWKMCCYVDSFEGNQFLALSDRVFQIKSKTHASTNALNTIKMIIGMRSSISFRIRFYAFSIKFSKYKKKAATNTTTTTDADGFFIHSFICTIISDLLTGKRLWHNIEAKQREIRMRKRLNFQITNYNK